MSPDAPSPDAPSPVPEAPPPASRATALALLDNLQNQIVFTPQQQKETEVALMALLASEDEETRAIALFGLAAVEGDQAVAVFTQALQDDNVQIRKMAAAVLADIGDSAAIADLQRALQDDHEEVQQAAQKALRQLLPESQSPSASPAP